MRLRVHQPFRCCRFFLSELKQRNQRLLMEIHRLARFYHWPQAEILGLSLARRRSFLGLIEEELDQQWSGGLGES